MKRVLSQSIAAALALGGLAATAQAQTVIVRSLPCGPPLPHRWKPLHAANVSAW
jgi:hypothetical protein